MKMPTESSCDGVEIPTKPDRANDIVARFKITLGDFVPENWRFWSEHQHLLAAYVYWGRPARVNASLGVRDGVVWEKGFQLMVEKEWSFDHDTGTYGLGIAIARAQTGSPHFISSQHPSFMSVGPAVALSARQSTRTSPHSPHPRTLIA